MNQPCACSHAICTARSHIRAALACGKGLSYELRPFGVSVTTVCPAAIDTGLYPLSEGMRATLRRFGLLQSPKSLVSKALRAMFRGRRVLSPGLMNWLLPPLIAILPGRLIDRLGIRWIYKKY